MVGGDMLLLGADRRGVSRDGWKGEIVKMEREIERGGKKYVLPYYEYCNTKFD
jgi:hypothetical protein